MVVCSSPVAGTETLDISPVSSKEVVDAQATTGCGLILKHVLDMIKYMQLNEPYR